MSVTFNKLTKMEEKIDLEKSVLQLTMPMATQTSLKVCSSQETLTPQGPAEANKRREISLL